MSGKLAEVEERIGTVYKMSAVITAMRGIAASRVQDANRHLDAIRLYAETIGEAIGHALTFSPSLGTTDGPPSEGGEAIVVLCAEQGFAGSFSEKVLEAAQAAATSSEGPAEILLVGDRGLLIAHEFGVEVNWAAPMVAHPARTAHLAGRIVEAVFERISDGRATGVSIIHAVPGGEAGFDVISKRLVPFDYSRFPAPDTSVQPVITLNADDLLARLVEEYVFAEIDEAVMMSFAAENEARMRAMIAAHDNVTSSMAELVGQARRLRQDAITEEIMELATGSLQSR